MRPSRAKTGIDGGGASLPRIRWNLNLASIEFGIARKDLLRRLDRNGAVADKGTYSTQQITEAIYDAQYHQRTELYSAQAAKFRLANALKAGELIPAKEVNAIWQKTASTLRPLIMSMTAPDSDKRRVFEALFAIETTIVKRTRKVA